jgi:hypothetical protein
MIPDPDGLVKKAGDLLAKNENIGAFNNYKKAANIYMEDRSYFKAFEVFKMMDPFHFQVAFFL